MPNPCDINNGECADTCTNNNGSPECSCTNGKLNGDGKSCDGNLYKVTLHQKQVY